MNIFAPDLDLDGALAMALADARERAWRERVREGSLRLIRSAEYRESEWRFPVIRVPEGARR